MLSFALAEISTLLDRLTASNYATSTRKIIEFLETFGPGFLTDILRITTRYLSNPHAAKFFSRQILGVLDETNFVSVVNNVFAEVPDRPGYADFLQSVLDLQPAQMMILFIAFTDSKNGDIRSDAHRYLSQPRNLDPSFIILSDTMNHRLFNICSRKRLPNALKQIKMVMEHHWPKLSRVPTDLTPIFLSFDSKRDFNAEVDPNMEGIAPQIPSTDDVLRLSLLVADIGPSALSSRESFAALLAHVSEITEEEVALTVINMANTLQSDHSLPPWDISVFHSGFNIDWNKVMSCLDSPRFFLAAPASFSFLVAFFKPVAPLTLSFALSRWKNPAAQLTFLQFAIFAEPTFTFARSPRKIEIPSGISCWPLAKSGPIKQMIESGAWLSVDLIERLLDISLRLQTSVEALLEIPFKYCPVVLLLAMSQCYARWNNTWILFMTKLNFLFARSKGDILFSSTWPYISDYLLSFLQTNIHLPEMGQLFLGITSQKQLLVSILAKASPPFSLELAVHFSLLSGLNLKQWLMSKLEVEPGFLDSCIAFLRENLSTELLDHQTLTIFHSVTRGYNNPELRHILSQHNARIPFLPRAQPMQHIDLATIYFTRLYSGEIPVQQFVDIVAKLSTSSVPDEKAIALYLIEHLVAEFPRFASYEAPHAAMAGELLGSIIQRNLVTGEAVDAILFNILQSLHQSPGTGLYIVGATAVNQFRTRLADFPSFQNELMQILAPEKQRPQLSLTSLPVDTLSQIPHTWSTPPHNYIKQIKFYMNNMSLENVSNKVHNIRQVLVEEYLPWTAMYFVSKRLSIERAYHQVYLKFLYELDVPKFTDLTVQELYRNINSLFISEKLHTMRSERILLQNLGTVLGKLTLSRNKSVPLVQLPIKEMLIRAYSTGRLIGVVPFVTCFLESVNDSTIFTPLNPWIRELISILYAIQETSQIKMHIKFKIQHLFKFLQLDLVDIQPSTVFDTISIDKSALSTDFITKKHLHTNFEYVARDLQQLLNFKSEILTTVDNSVQMIIEPIIGRSIGIAISTTSSLVVQDFKSDPSTTKMRTAARTMANTLALQLAVAASSEHLRSTLFEALEKFFVSKQVPASIYKLHLAGLVNDNIPVALLRLHHLIQERSEIAIDEVLAPEYTRRETTFDTHYPTYSLPSTLVSVPTEDHLQIYTGYATISDNMAETQVFITGPFDDWIQSVQAEMTRLNQLCMEPGMTTFPENRLLELSKTVATQLRQPPRLEAIAPLVTEIMKLVFNLHSQGLQLLEMPTMQQEHRAAFSLVQVFLTFFIRTLVEIKEKVKAEWFTEMSTNFLLRASSDIFQKEGLDTKLAFLFFEGGLIQPAMIDKILALMITKAKSLEAFELGLLILERYVTNQLEGIGDVYRIIQALDITVRAFPEDPDTNYGRFNLVLDRAKEMLVTVGQSLNTPENTYKHWVEHSDHEAALASFRAAFSLAPETTVAELMVLGLEYAAGTTKPAFLAPSDAILVQQDGRTVDISLVDVCANIVTTFLAASPDYLASLTHVVSALASLVPDRAYQVNEIAHLANRIFQAVLSGPQAPKYRSHILTILTSALIKLRPKRVPTFAFFWMDIITKPFILGPMLEDRECWELYLSLVIALLDFLYPFLESMSVNLPLNHLYVATLRLFLLIMHDFPDFLCEHHLSLVSHIPVNSVQLMNVVLSAYPEGMVLPNPFTQGQDIGLTPEAHEAPTVRGDHSHHIAMFRRELDDFLNGDTSDPSPILSAVQSSISPSLMNALVFYVCDQAVSHRIFDENAPHKLLNFLASRLDDEGSFKLYSAMANQLRYPNSHTFFCSRMFLALFVSAPGSGDREQMIRILLEKLIAFRPHPWGSLVTLIQLGRNPVYRETTMKLVSGAPEIEQLFKRLN